MRRNTNSNSQAKKKSKSRVSAEHTVGLGNVEEGKLAAKAKPKKKRVRKRPVLQGAAFKNVN